MHARYLRIFTLGLAVLATSCTRPSDSNEVRQLEFKSENQDGTQQANADRSASSGNSARKPASAPAASPPLDRPPELLSREELNDGWLKLFDGQTLFGWKANSNANWTADGGAIKADSGEPGMLMTTVPWGDYELKLEYRLSKGGNSGVFLRSAFEPKNPAADCYELNFCDSHPEYPTGSIVGRQKATRTVSGEGDWKSVRVRVDGPHIEAEFDGEPAVEFNDESPSALAGGLIGLQMNGGSIEFRNVTLRPLELQSIFNGEDLSGWHTVPGSKSRFDVADGTIHVKNGPGFLESDRQWGDFVLQVEARTNGESLNRPLKNGTGSEHLGANLAKSAPREVPVPHFQHVNSGIFFRAMPGTENAPSNGYELQIQNAVKDGDRSQPVDFGTGAIFRRQKVRWVVPDNNNWFSMTLVASGDRFAAWVDGLQVTDWTDTRPENENPREGRRLEPGHLILQGHDATTDLNFRNIRIADLPPHP
jgi:hypothetical protein